MDINMKNILKSNRKLLYVNFIIIFIASILSTLIAYMIKIIIDVAVSSDLVRLKNVIVFSIIFLLFYFTFSYLKSYFSKKFQNAFINKLRFMLVQKTFDRTPENFKKYASSEYLSIITNDIQLLNEGLLNSSIIIAQNIVSAFITVMALFCINSYIAVIVIVCIIVMYLVPHTFGKIVKEHQIQLSGELTKLTALTKSYLNGFGIIFTYVIQKKCIDKFSAVNEVVTKSRMKMDKKISLSESLSAVLSIGTEFLVLFLSALSVIQGKITIGTMVAVMQLSGAFIQPIMIIMQNIPKVIGGRAIIQKFEEVLSDQPTGFCGIEPPDFQEKIEIKNLTFAYDESHLILDNVNCIFEKNKKYALVGKSGSGKSTLIGLLSGMSSNYAGSILFDKKELKNLNINQVMSFITMTQQNTFLFDTTILDNITLGDQYDKNMIDKICQMSGVDQFLDETEDGLNTNIIDCGNNLSGGQKQRISIARALIKKKSIMILDEGTAAVDKKTAFDIENRLLHIPDLTLITVTHNLDHNLLKKYDKILFFQSAKVLEMDTYQNLLKNSEAFQQFINISYDSLLEANACMSEQ